MARIRTIKPEFWEDEKIAKLPMNCRLFYIGTWNFADDFGCIKGSASLIKSQIFPYDENLRVSELKKWLDALVDARMLIPISHNDEGYYIIRTFRSHQILDKRYERSFIGKDIVNKVIEDSLREHGVTTTSPQGGHIIGNGNGNGNGKSNARKAFTPPSLEDVECYFEQKGYTKSSAKKAYEYYNEGGWSDGNGKQVINWKQKMISVWFKDENKQKNEKPTYADE